MITSVCRTSRTALTAVFVLVFTAGLWPQSRLVPASEPVAPRDLNSSLAELSRVAPATDQDLANLHAGGKLHWVAFWRRNQAHKAQEATSLRRNLRFAVPNLIHDAQTSGGSISTTFKLYNDLSVVCESLDSLLPPGSHGGKAELTALTRDLSDLNRIREEISSHIQRTAAALEAKHPELVSAGHFPKRIIIDDNVPDKPSARKRRSSNQ